MSDGGANSCGKGKVKPTYSKNTNSVDGKSVNVGETHDCYSLL